MAQAHDHGDGHDHDHGHAHDHGGHGHDHGHDHGLGHHHHELPQDADWRYAIGIGLNLAFVLAETAAGFLSNSTALFADAGHNLSDVLGLALAGGAAWLARQGGGERRTYGYGKATIFAALINGLLLVFASGAIVLEASRRLLHPEHVQTLTVMATAAIGVLINGATALMFMRGRHGDANLRAAFLHMAADAGISAAVIVAGLLIAVTGALWLDPLASIAVVVVVLIGSFRLLKEATDMAMDAAPRGIDVAAVKRFLAEQPGVSEVHDLHIWSLDAASSALTAHLVRPDAHEDDAFLRGLCVAIQRRFGIAHATIQIERQSFDCHPDHR
jgi:cobalt-zinc-cadmium efflux system protein